MIRSILAAFLFLAVALTACTVPDAAPPTLAPAPLPSPTALPTATGLPTAVLPTPTRSPTPTQAPIPRSQVRTLIGQPLSSGLSLPDVVETALLSVVEIQTPAGIATGFIATADGQIITNDHVVTGIDRVNLRLVSGVQYSAQVTSRHKHP